MGGSSSAEPKPHRLWTLPNPTTGAVARFALEDAEWLRHLSDNGYVVIAGALDSREVERAHDLMWEFLESKPWGWRRGQEGTWVPPYKLFKDWGIIKSHGAGQCEVAWFCRTQPTVKQAFAKIWATEDLLSAFDGFNIFLPWHHGHPEYRTMEGSRWLHSDQGPDKDGLHAVQSFVALTDQDGSTGGFQVMPRSHHLHREWVTSRHFDHDFCLLEHAQPERDALRGLSQQLVSCKAGDMVLWDSRVVHCNTHAQTPPTTPSGELLRVAIYVCHIPTSKATARDLELRRAAYDRGLSCNHWPLFGDEDLDIFENNMDSYQPPALAATTDGRHSLVTGAASVA